MIALAAWCAPCAAKLSTVEAAFAKVPSASKARDTLFNLTRRAHIMGSPGDWENARYVRDTMAALGFDSKIETVEVMLNYPAEAPSLAAVDPSTGAVLFSASLSEEVLPSDITSDTAWRNHTFNSYAPSGDVTAPVVYANYGT